MSSQPNKIILITNQPLLTLNFRQLLEMAGWSGEHVILRPHGASGILDPEAAMLTVIDSEAGLSWDVLKGLCAQMPRSRFVLWCNHVTPQLVQEAMQSGMHGLLALRLPLPEAADAMVQIWRGERQYRFEGEFRSRPSAELTLTPREQQIVALVMEGRRNREIAAALHTTEGCVKVHMNRIFSKTGAKNRYELARAGNSVLRRGSPRGREQYIPLEDDDPFDAGWMFTERASDFPRTGEVSYDSIER